MSDAPVLRPVAIARTYRDLQNALRTRSDELNMTRAALDQRAGLADGHASKLLAPRARKRLGKVSFELVLAALGLAVVVVEDSEAVEHLERQIEVVPACESACEKPPHWRSTKGSAWGRRMAARRALKLTAAERTAIARKANRARQAKAAATPK
jgi:hypothetical protein